ncbi:hypothetical protein [Tenacibaculum singaporense]|uniref:Uncharacterized protein n=1 Tax=Tenacibaculum singaporense TaxID=2358479 RepID=A0A3Q8RQS4_9FLAO|nr:hypothetical protein [Tenacibaculum singaporense]AZJ34513.1 hypothetical protein D6T69_02790 [Tenacibaculum singaporense]RSC95006.1 hypothetical protein EI424_04980 [Tenacibaculum singaporense]
MNQSILIPLIVGVVSAILGYLLGRLLSKSKNGNEKVLLKNKIAKLESSLRKCKESRSILETDLKLAKESSVLIPFDASLAKTIFGKKIKENDLKIIEGVGPKIEELFHNSGISTWKELGETSIDKCQEVLKSGGDRYRAHKPNTWPKQAQLAYEGKWQELKEWQDNLDGGKA